MIGPGGPSIEFRLGSEAVALGAFSGELAGAADGFGLFALAPFRGLLEMPAKLHFAKDSLPLHLFLERLQRLVDVVVAYVYFHGSKSLNTFCWLGCWPGGRKRGANI